MPYRKTIGATILSMMLVTGSVAKADPISDFIGAVFHPNVAQNAPCLTRQSRLHRGVGRRTTRPDWRPNYTERYAAPASASSWNATTWRASFYGGGPRKYEPNSHTANGERFNQWGLTAAHRTLPFGTRLQVCFRDCTVVRVNDRGPALWTGRSLDLSRGAASQIGLIQAGSGAVRVTILN